MRLGVQVRWQSSPHRFHLSTLGEDRNSAAGTFAPVTQRMIRWIVRPQHDAKPIGRIRVDVTMLRKRPPIEHFCERARPENVSGHQRSQKACSIGDSANYQAVKDPARMIVFDTAHLHVAKIR